ncbi:hypothetical protein [Oceanispirochaeta sp.]|uniref:hypothetical protein n=1 Tax=Oceanispirochaeta sp. TaxID=2035350 RepID=UPI0026171FF5|nr:hypothetical protein [Oceanispirochaeta sp.]MDA3958108.1 hypothetical protein [Oceanispirochaeta sp.]
MRKKKEYLNHFITIDKDGVQDGLLIQKRNVIWEEISYLLDNSMLFLDTPWIVRDFYDERTEFNYWYLIYLARVRYPHWMEERILPGMLELIPEDRITGVSYLWIKNPDSLCSMENEIVTTGYPWNSLLYLMDLNTFLQKEIEIINPSESDFILQNQGCLF